MEILIALALGAGLLYVWLIGHWFGRVLAFLALAVVGFTIGMLAGDIVVAVIGVAVAWPVASIPIYCQHKSTSP